MYATYTHHMSIARQHEARARAHAARAAEANTAQDRAAMQDAAARAAREIKDAIVQTRAARRGMTPAQRQAVREPINKFHNRLFHLDFHLVQFSNDCTNFPTPLPA